MKTPGSNPLSRWYEQTFGGVEPQAEARDDDSSGPLQPGQDGQVDVGTLALSVSRLILRGPGFVQQNAFQMWDQLGPRCIRIHLPRVAPAGESVAPEPPPDEWIEEILKALRASARGLERVIHKQVGSRRTLGQVLADRIDVVRDGGQPAVEWIEPAARAWLSPADFLHFHHHRVFAEPESGSAEPPSIVPWRRGASVPAMPSALDVAARWFELIRGVPVSTVLEDRRVRAVFRCSEQLAIGFRAFLWVVLPESTEGAPITREDILHAVRERFRESGWSREEFNAEWNRLPQVRAGDEDADADTSYRIAARDAFYDVFVIRHAGVEPGAVWIRPGFIPALELEQGSSREFHILRMAGGSGGVYTYGRDLDPAQRAWFAPYTQAGRAFEPLHHTLIPPVRRSDWAGIAHGPSELMQFDPRPGAGPAARVLPVPRAGFVERVPHVVTELHDIWNNPIGTHKGWLTLAGIWRDGRLQADTSEFELSSPAAAGRHARVGLSRLYPNLVRSAAVSARVAEGPEEPYPLLLHAASGGDVDVARLLGGDRGAVLISPNQEGTQRWVENLSGRRIWILEQVELDAENLAPWVPLEHGVRRIVLSGHTFHLRLPSEAAPSHGGPDLILTIYLGSNVNADRGAFTNAVDHAARVRQAIEKTDWLRKAGLVGLEPQPGGSNHGVRFISHMGAERVHVKAIAAATSRKTFAVPRSEGRLRASPKEALEVIRKDSLYRQEVFHGIWWLDGTPGAEETGQDPARFHELHAPEGYYVFVMRDLPTIQDSQEALSPRHFEELAGFLRERILPHGMVFYDAYDLERPGASDSRLKGNLSALSPAGGDARRMIVIDLDSFGIAESVAEAWRAQRVILDEAAERSSELSVADKAAIHAGLEEWLSVPGSSPRGEAL